MSDDEPKDEPTDDSEQRSEQQPSDTDQPAEHSEEQPTDSGQPADQSEEQAAESDQAAGQAEEQSTDSDQQGEQAEKQPADSDQPADQSGDATGGGGGGGGSGGGVGGGGRADDAVAADSGKKLQVTAEFTQEGGQKFVGDYKINVHEWDERKGQQGGQLFGGGAQDWQSFDSKRPSSISTPMLQVFSPAVRIVAGARVELGERLPRGQQMLAVFDFQMPRGDSLQAKFDVELGNVNEVVNAKTSDEAKGVVTKLPQFETKVLIRLDAKPIGKQQFRVTGRYYTGKLYLVQANAQAAA